MANLKIGGKGCLEETPQERGCAAGMGHSGASLVLWGQGTGQLCRSFRQNPCLFLSERRGGGAACVLEEAEQGGRGWRSFSSCVEAVSALCWCVDPRGSSPPPYQGTTPVPVSAPHVAMCTPTLVPAPHAAASPRHTWGYMEEQHPRQQESSIAEHRRAVHPYWGRGKTAASVIAELWASPLFPDAATAVPVYFLICSSRPGSSSPTEQQPVPWMAGPPRGGSGTFCCSAGLRGRRAPRSLRGCGNVQPM